MSILPVPSVHQPQGTLVLGERPERTGQYWSPVGGCRGCEQRARDNESTLLGVAPPEDGEAALFQVKFRVATHVWTCVAHRVPGATAVQVRTMSRTSAFARFGGGHVPFTAPSERPVALASHIMAACNSTITQRQSTSAPACGRMLPDVQNETSDEQLFELVDTAVLPGNDEPQDLPPIAPYLTVELLRRVHERVVHLINDGRCNMSKHKSLAVSICRLTGVRIPPDERDVEKVGNHVDIWLRRNYIDAERKLFRNLRNKENLERKRMELRLSCCCINAMGRLEHFHGPFDDPKLQSDISRRPPPYVPYTSSSLPAPMSMIELKQAASDCRREAISALALSGRERQRFEHERLRAEAVKSRCKRAVNEAASARKLAKSFKQEKLNAEAEAARQLRDFAQQARAESSRKERHANQLLKQEQAKVLRLGSLVATATYEAGVHAQREAHVQNKANEERTQAEAELRRLEEELALQRREHLRVEQASAKALLDARGRVLRLGNQVAAASQEAAIHAQKEADAVQQLEQERARAEAEAQLRRDEAIQERANRKKEERAKEQLLNDARAKVLRLGCQVAVATQDAARLAREKEAMAREKEEQEREIKEAQAEHAYLVEKAMHEARVRRQYAHQMAIARNMREAVKQTSHKRLLAKKELSEQFKALAHEHDELLLEVSSIRAERDANAGAAQMLASISSWRHERKHKGRRGGGRQIQYHHRLAILEQHANGTPSSAIGKNIVSVVKKVAPWLEPVEPTKREIQMIGFELPTLEEALAARRTASAHRVRLLGFDETTDLQVPVVTSNIQVQDVEGGHLENVVLKAAYLSTKGSTSEAVTSEIEDKCFSRLRDLLRTWKKYHNHMFPDVPWTGPDVQNCSLHRLAGGGALMSDTCNSARKTRRLLGELIQKQAEASLRESHGDDGWESMAEEERAKLLRVYSLDCHHHLRNIWLGHMSRKQAAYVHEELATQLKEFAAWERMSTDFEQLLRAVYKEFHQGGRYYKGKGADFSSWMLEKYPDSFFMHIERADGGRQVLSA